MRTCQPGEFGGLYSAGEDYSRTGLGSASHAPAWLGSALSAPVPHPSSIRAQIFPSRSVSPRDLLGAGLICTSKVGPCKRELALGRVPGICTVLGLACPSGLVGLCHLSCSQLCLELLQEPHALKKTLLRPQPLFQMSQLLLTEAAWLRSPSPQQAEEILVSAPAVPWALGVFNLGKRQ